MNEAIGESISAQVQIDVNGENFYLHKNTFNPFVCVLVAVKSVSIQETIGKENEETALICTASGGRSLPTITWSMPEKLGI